MNLSAITYPACWILLGSSLLGACTSVPKVKVEYITPQFQSEWLEPCSVVKGDIIDEEDLATYIVKMNYELKACSLKIKHIKQTLEEFKEITK